MNGRELANSISQILQTEYGENLSPSLIHAHLAHETGNFSSELATKHHNYGGLTQTAPNDLKQPDGSNYYMNFDSDEDFANYMASYYNKYKEDGIFNARDVRSFAEALKHGGYFGDSVDNYVSGMESFIGTPSFSDFITSAYNKTTPTEPVVKQEEIEEASFEDKFKDSLYDSVIWGGFRTAATLKDLDDQEGYKVTQEDIDRVQKELGGDYTATLWVCQNADSPAQLDRLMRMKKEDLARRKRVDASDIGLDTTGTILGAFLDPLNFLPAIGAVGKVGKAAKYAELASMTAAANVVDRGLTQRLTGYEQDYPMAAVMGAFAGAGLPLAIDLLKSRGSKATKEAGEQLFGEATNIAIDAEKLATGQKTSQMSTNAQEFVASLEKVHDKDFVKSIKDATIAGQLRPKHGVYVVSKADAKKLVEARGFEFDENAKGFFDDESGVSVLIKDNLSGTEDIHLTLLHERGAHGLKYALSENDYKKVIAALKHRMTVNPSPAIERAIKRAGGNADPEEVLGYLAEEMKPSNPLMRNIKKAMQKGMNTLGYKGSLSDDDFIDILTKGAKHYEEGKTGYRVYSDGSCNYKGIHYSKKNMLNPDKATMAMGTLSFKEGAKNIYNNIVDFAKRNPLLATPYSVCSSSVSKTLKEMGDILFENPYMNKTLKTIPVETYKKEMSNKMEHMLNNYMKARDKALVRLQHLSADAKQEFNKQVIMAYNQKYAKHEAGLVDVDFPPEVWECVEHIHRMRRYAENIAVKPERYIGAGYGIRNAPIKDAPDEFYRWIDADNWLKVFQMFGEDKKKMREFFYDYIQKAADRDSLRKMIENERKIKWENDSRIAKEAGKEAPEFKEMTDEEFEKELKKRAWETANGWADLGASNIHKNTANNTLNAIGDLDFLKDRFPLDTSLEVIVNGNTFSFDGNMRSFDIDTYLHPIINRLSGEVAMTTAFQRGTLVKYDNPLGFSEHVEKNIHNTRAIVEAELENKVQTRQITTDDKNKELEAFDFGIAKLRGLPTTEHASTLGDAVARTLNTYAYARNSGNMVFNQLGEMSGVLAYAGFNAVFDMLPYLKRMVTEARLGKGSEDMLQEARLATFGDEGHKFIFGNVNDSSSKMYRDILGETRTAKVLDKFAGFANASASVASKLTLFQATTERMINSAQKQTLIDLAQWVNGKDFPSYRNPFSEGKLRNVGLTEEADIKAFRDSLKEFIKLDEKGNLVGFDVRKLHIQNPKLYMRYYQLVQAQVKRCITMPAIGNTNMLKEQSPFWKVFFMFKDFTMRAAHSQSGRVASNREMDDCFATIYSMATNLVVVTGLATLRSKYVINRDNEGRHKRYMDDYLSPEALMYTAFFRSNILGSPFSYVNDVAEATGVSPVPSIRTTTNRYSRDKSTNEAVGSYLMQLPAIKTGTDFIESGYNVVNDDRYTQKDFNKLLQLLPLQNMIPVMRLRDELVKASGLPKRD